MSRPFALSPDLNSSRSRETGDSMSVASRYHDEMIFQCAIIIALEQLPRHVR
jgi:hypothetical protein